MQVKWLPEFWSHSSKLLNRGGGHWNTQFIAALLETWVTWYLQLAFEAKAVLGNWVLNLGNLIPNSEWLLSKLHCWSPSWCPQRTLAGVRKYPRQLEFAEQSNREEGSAQQDSSRDLQRGAQESMVEYWLAHAWSKRPKGLGLKPPESRENHSWTSHWAENSLWHHQPAVKSPHSAGGIRVNPQKSIPLGVLEGSNWSQVT